MKSYTQTLTLCDPCAKALEDTCREWNKGPPMGPSEYMSVFKLNEDGVNDVQDHECDSRVRGIMNTPNRLCDCIFHNDEADDDDEEDED